MSYKLVQLDNVGNIRSVSEESFLDSQYVLSSFQMSVNASQFDFIDESQIQTFTSRNSDNMETNLIPDGPAFVYRSSDRYDPRVECILTIANPSGNVSSGNIVQQDITRVTTFAGSESFTLPYHSTFEKKFGTSSARFTKPSNSALTGGGLIVTNLNKNNSPIDDVVGASIDYAVEFFFNASPSAYAEDFTLVQRGTNATGAWKISYDQSSNVVEFKFRSPLGACGSFPINYTIISGPTGNTWYHVAVSVIRNGGSQFPATVAGYFNGATAFVNSSATGSSIPAYSGSMPIYIGNSDVGNESFNGYIDSFRYLISNAVTGGTSGVFGTAGYGFVPHGGGTLGVPTLEGFTVGNQTSFTLNFNNTDGSTAFYAQSTDYITAIATRVTPQTLGVTSAPSSAVELGVREVFRIQKGITGATGLSDGVGFSSNYGAIAVPYVNIFSPGTTGYYQHGFDYAFNLFSIYDTGLTFTSFSSIYNSRINKELTLELNSIIEGVCSGAGSSGSPLAPRFGTNPFRRLFGTGGSQTYGACGNHNSLFLDPKNSTVMSYIFSNALLAQSGVSLSTYSFIDAAGITRTITSSEIMNLRLDILEHQNRIINTNKEALDNVGTSTTKNAVKKSYIDKKTTKVSIIVEDAILPPTKQ